MRFLGRDLKRAFTNKGFLLSFVVTVLIFAHAVALYDPPAAVREIGRSMYEIIIDSQALSGYFPFAAVFPAMGYAVAFCTEYRSGYLRMITTRMDWRKYGIIRTISVALSGGAVVGIPIAGVCVYAWIFGVHGAPGSGFEIYSGTVMETYIEQYGDLYIPAFKVLLGFCFGVMWALAAMAFAVWTCNRYVSVIAPFILYEVMWDLLYPDFMMFDPIYLVRGDDLQNYPLSLAMELMYIAIAFAAVWLGLRRRMRDA